MISTSGEIVKEPTKPANYQEGPWVYKRNGHYYMSYASTCCPEGIGYAMSDSATGPWEYKGMIVEASDKTRGNHPGIIDFKGKSYCFGHSYDLIKSKTSTFYERRSVDMDEIIYNEDGTIQTLSYWSNNGPEPADTVNPFKRVEAETMAWSEGVKSEKNTETGVYITNINTNDFIEVQSVDFGNGAKKFEAIAASMNSGIIEIYIDSKEGTPIGVCQINNTGSWNTWKTFTTKVKITKGVHNVFFVFKGTTEDELLNLDAWKFNK